MSKSFQVPPPVTWTDVSGNVQTMAFVTYAMSVWLDDPQAAADASGKPGGLVQMNRWFKFMDEFEAGCKTPGVWFTADDQNYVVLKRIIETGTRTLQSMRGMQACLPFSKVVLEAVDHIQTAVVQ